jgi:hypothetical protein
MPYIKLLYKGNIYGPISGPSTLKLICAILRISSRAMPCLQSLDREKVKVIIDSSLEIQNGFYELLVNTDVEYDEALDGGLHTAKNVIPALPNKIQQKPIISKNESKLKLTKNLCAIEDDGDKQEFPLSEFEMAACLNAMMELISSIPSRYIKYNTKLSAQIDTSLIEVDEWSKKLKDTILNQNDEGWSVKITFIQYRFLFKK